MATFITRREYLRSRKSASAARRNRRRWLLLEALEDRTVLSTLVILSESGTNTIEGWTSVPSGYSNYAPISASGSFGSSIGDPANSFFDLSAGSFFIPVNQSYYVSTGAFAGGGTIPVTDYFGRATADLQVVKQIVPTGDHEEFGDPVLVIASVRFELFSGTGHFTASINDLSFNKFLPSLQHGGGGEFLARIGDTVTITLSSASTVSSTGQYLHSFNGGDVHVSLAPIVNRPPVLGAIGDRVVSEGSALNFAASATDPDPGQTLTYSLDSAPTGASIDPATGAISYSAVDGPASFPVTVRVTDNGVPSLSDEESFTITVNNVAPSNVVLGVADADESDVVTLNGSFFDPGIFDTHTVDIDWGDGSSDTIPLGTNILTFNKSHRYLNNLPGGAPYTIGVTVTDKDGDSSSGQIGVTVRNVAPNGLFLSTSAVLSTIDENETVTIDGVFFDPGTLDAHQVQINWSDGQIETLSVVPFARTFTATHKFLDNLPNDSPYTITAIVTDSDGDSGVGSVPLTVRNVPPRFSAVFLPPNVVDEGDTIVVSGFFDDPGTKDTHDVRVIWGDGHIDAFNLALGEFSFAAVRQFLQNAPGDAPYTFQVVIGDDDGGADAGIPYEYVVRNVAPVASIAGPTVAAVQNPVTFTLGATDKGPIDQSADFTYRIDWNGDGSVDQTVIGPASLQVGHVFPTAGAFNVRVTATDIDGGQSAAATQAITIYNAIIVDGNIAVGGTDSDDTVIVNTGNTGDVTITRNGTKFTNPAGGDTFPVPIGGRVIVYGGTGDDRLLAVGDTAVEIHGGAGDDMIRGGFGNDILIGDGGNDTLMGGGGRDLLIGGIGSDRIFGNTSDDILIAGHTAYDDNSLALTSLMLEWSGANEYGDRVANLQTGGGLAAGYRLTGNDGPLETVFNDNDIDYLIGSQGQDWFLANQSADNGGVLDEVSDQDANEIWSDIDFWQ